MEWFSYVIAIAIGLSAVISPIATAIINNKHQLRLKELEIYELTKRNALENYTKCASQANGSAAPITISAYYESLNNLYIYFSDIPESVNSLLSHSGKSFTNELTSIVQVLSKQIGKQ